MLNQPGRGQPGGLPRTVTRTCLRINSIEVLRGLAALSVAVAHSDSLIGGNPDLPFGRWHSFAMPGTAGVEFFFVLSGFVMAVAHRHDMAVGGNVGRFLWKRFCRIYPLYWIVLLFPLYRFWGAPSLTAEAILGWLSLLPVRSDNLLVVAWTLRQEVTFYLVLALCLIPRIGRFVLALWVVATVCWWFVLPRPPVLPFGALAAGHVFSLFNFEFFAGLAAGWLLPRWPRSARLGSTVLALAVVGLAWRMALDGWGAEYGPVHARPIYGLAYAGIILSLAVLERDGAIRYGPRATTFAGWAGALSYPLYLSHLLTLDFVAARLGPSGAAARLGPDATFAIMLLCAVIAAAVLALVVDQPLQRALRRLSAGNTPRPPTPAAWPARQGPPQRPALGTPTPPPSRQEP